MLCIGKQRRLGYDEVNWSCVVTVVDDVLCDVGNNVKLIISCLFQ